MQAKWVKEGNFFKNLSLPKDTILLHAQRYYYKGSNNSINYFDLLGYKDGTFKLYIHAVNTFTFPTLCDKFKTVLNSNNNEATKAVSISIENLAHFEETLRNIHEIDNLDAQTDNEIQTLYKWWLSKDKYESIPNHLNSITSKELTGKEEDPIEVTFFNALKARDLEQITSLLQHGINPNLTNNVVYTGHDFGCSPLLVAFLEYDSRRQTKQEKKEWLQIIKVLLDYGADPDFLHPGFKKSTLTLASEFGGVPEVTNLILNHEKNISFKLSDNYEYKDQSIFKLLSKHFSRIYDRNIEKQNRQSDVLDIKFLPEKGITEFCRKNGENITAALVKNDDIKSDERDKLFALYSKYFGTKEVSEKEDLRSRFNAKFGFDNSRRVLVYIIRDNKNEIIGFNSFELHETNYTNKPCIISYGSLACLDKYRGSGITTPLSFGAILALKYLLKDSCQTELYVMFDSIHLNSYRLIFELPHYPRNRCGFGNKFVKHILEVIYGKERADKFDGVKHVYLETASFVKEKLPSPDEYDLPWLIDFFVELTENKGGVPVILPVTKDAYNYFAKKLKNTNFDEYSQQLGNYLVEKGFVSKDIFDIKDTHKESDNLLWPSCQSNCMV